MNNVGHPILLASVRTAGKASMGEQIVYTPSRNLQVGDHVDLYPTYPAGSERYGVGRISERRSDGSVVAIRIA